MISVIRRWIDGKKLECVRKKRGSEDAYDRRIAADNRQTAREYLAADCAAIIDAVKEAGARGEGRYVLESGRFDQFIEWVPGWALRYDRRVQEPNVCIGKLVVIRGKE